jgi:serine/threonine-protein kinase
LEELERLRSALSDRYRVEREIGHGGMATVYLAQDLKHHRHVAIKVLRPDLAATVGPERFLREIQIEASLQHINILPLHDSGRSDGFLYFVMPYVEGESLRDRLVREKQLPLEDALRITHEIADALSYAHDHGVVHRDIKPENILLSEGHAVLADFGIARAVDVAGGQTFTATGQFVGTPQYMSPEQASGDQDLDGRSDLYSLGCVLYEMLAGEPPFTGRTAQRVLTRHLSEHPPPLPVECQSVPTGVVEAIEKALAKAPADRFPTASDFLVTLETPEPEQPVGRLLRFLRALWKRLVLQVGLAYLAFAWLAVEFTRMLVEQAAVERWVTPVIVVLLAVAFPVVLVMSWTREQQQLAGRATPWPRWVQRIHPGHMLALLAVLILGLLAGRYQLERFLESTPSVEASAGLNPTSVAVLYFDDHSPGGQQGHLAASFTTGLITQLTQVDALTVRSLNAVKPYRYADVGTDSIAQALDVGTLVEGSVLVSGDRVRVSVGLVNGLDGAQLESRELERPLGDILTLMDEVSQEVSRFLRRHLGAEIRMREWRAGTESPAAWELLQRAEELRADVEPLVMTGDTTTALMMFERADSLLARVEALDQNWVEPIVQRGWIAADRARMLPVSSRTYGPEWARLGIAHAERALALDPTHPGALELRGTLRRYLWESADSVEAAQLNEGAETDLRAAVAIDPSRARAWGSLARILRVSGRFAEAKQAALMAYEADAFLADARSVIFILCHASLELKEFDDVLRWCGEGRQRFPDRRSFVTLELLAVSGPEGPEPDPDGAWRLARKFEELSPPQSRAEARATGLLRVAAVLARSGLADSAEAVITQARAAGTQNEMTDYYEANARLQLGQRDRALSLLRRYLEARPDRKAYLAEDWWWRPLRDDPRFQALVGAAQ